MQDFLHIAVFKIFAIEVYQYIAYSQSCEKCLLTNNVALF